MRPLEPRDETPLAAPSFWDHLGATRAEEYAQDEILPQVPVFTRTPPAPEQMLPELSPADCYQGSLEDTLQAIGAPLEIPNERPLRLAQTTSPAALGVLRAQTALPGPTGPLAEMMPPARATTRRRARPRVMRDSRLLYRLQRIWLTPIYRLALTFGLPALAVIGALSLYFGQEANREAVMAQVDRAYAAVVDRPEFMVTTIRWPEVTPELDAALREKLQLDLPQSSFRLDLDALRAEVEALDWVRAADLRLLSDGVLALSIQERSPVVLWRSEAGLELLDAEGIRVAYVLSRDFRADLPLIAGAGANAQIREALDLLDAAAPLGPRALGLVRVGERRWDVVLDRGQRIKLPENGALSALERVIALEQAQDLLSRDLVTADLRNPSRPVLQLSPGAMDTLREIRAQATENVR